MAMGIRLDGWPLDLIVATGWLLLVASVGVLFAPDDATLAHGGYGKIAMICVVISTVIWLSAPKTALINRTKLAGGSITSMSAFGPDMGSCTAHVRFQDHHGTCSRRKAY
jgi:hypothetical protein